jgi:ribulose-5-phosphate 4-epimerase/fuculose-1-phosphate aldolase
MNDALQQARIDLAVALRWAARLNLSEGVCNHFSLAAPGMPGRFLINPQGFHWSEITPRHLLLVDVKGRVIEGEYTVEPTAFYIHSRLHNSAKAPACIMHTHMPYATALAILENGRLEPASQNALRFYGRIGYDDEYNGLVTDEAEGDRLAGRLEGADVLFLANHGVIVCGDNVANTFDDLYYLERACMLQILAQSTGRMLKRVPHAVASETVKMMVEDREQSIALLAACRRMLDREEPGWCD